MFRKIFILLQILQFMSLILSKGRKKNLSFLFKEGVLLTMTNWALIEKWLEKQRWSSNMLEKILKWKSNRF